MNIGDYTFEEFKDIAARFHGYPAPGLLLGGYMVEQAKSLLPEGTIFDALVETKKCLPDAVQLLTLCSYGNGWMRVLNLGRYALALYDKYTGQGVRVHLDLDKLAAWPEIKAWYLKEKPKKEQDTKRLLAEIEAAGHHCCTAQPVQMPSGYLKRHSMGVIQACPACGEAYPARDGAVCRGCQGETPYCHPLAPCAARQAGADPYLRSVPVEQAVGKKVLHDMTRIVAGVDKGPAFTAGQTITVGDVCRLQQMGREHIYLEEEAPDQERWVHENEAALAFARRMAGPGVSFDETPKEGKITFRAEREGLLCLDRHKLLRFNMFEGVMCATRQANLVVEKDKPFAAARAIPLYLERKVFAGALEVLGSEPLFRIQPLKPMNVGILVTGSEVFQGLIEDKFAPIITGKVEHFGCKVLAKEIVPDDREAIGDAVRRQLDAGVELVITTAGLSVDPDDVTRLGLQDAGLRDAFYGMPVLPGAMSLVGRLGSAWVIGVPACALFFKTTAFDLLLPRVLAEQEFSRQELGAMGEGSFCLNCRSCTFPKCPFGK